MNRRQFLHASAATCLSGQVLGALRQERLDGAGEILARAQAEGRVQAAVLHVAQGAATFTRSFGAARGEEAMFLLGSISKPICVLALMALFDRGAFALDDPLRKYLPEFTGAERERVTLRHLLTHTSGLPDQLPENGALRQRHASLAEFTAHAARLPVHFAPGSQYEYSSMGILLATHVAELLAGTELARLVPETVLQPLGMTRSALGLGRFALGETIPCQTEFAAPEAGGGDPKAKDWDWNSPWWRSLGAPWGGVHASAPDLARFLGEFLHERGAVVKPETARLMVRNQNPPGLAPRGLGLALGPALTTTGCSGHAFGHTGSTGTIAWADPATQTTCVILTSLPARAVQPHPRDLAAQAIVAAAAPE